MPNKWPEPMDIMKIATEKPRSLSHRFDPENPTYLQTDSTQPEKCHWYLKQGYGGADYDPAYHIEIRPTPQGVAETLAQVGGKTWVDKAQLMEAMMPAIRAAAYGKISQE